MSGTKQDILNPNYWRDRLETSRTLHHAIFKCPTDEWKRIATKHKQILANLFEGNPDDSVLDVGCGWGRLLELMPSRWEGEYVGIDISPDFLGLAEQLHPTRNFLEGEFLGALKYRPTNGYDWAVMISIRPMMLRNLPCSHWEQVETELKRVASKLLYLEYDENDGGAIE